MLHNTKVNQRFYEKSDRVIHADAEKEPVSKLMSFINRPAYLCIVIITSIFITEALFMVALLRFAPLSTYAESLLDASVLALVLTPLLYFFLYRPYKLNIRAKDEALYFRDTALNEWDATMNCVGEMIAILDDDKRIRRINRSFCNFTADPEENIFGMPWITFLREHHLPVPPNSSESRIVFHEPTDTWFEINFYPLHYKDDVVNGTIVSLHNITEIKLMTKELERANKKIELSRNRLQFALNEVSKLIEIVTNKADTKIRLNNPHLEKCYDVKNCKKKNCVCYDKGALRCWQIAGTFCGGEQQGAFAEKYGSCAKCEVFQKATSDPIYGIAEQINNMMQVITIKHNELNNAHEELKSTRSRADADALSPSDE